MKKITIPIPKKAIAKLIFQARSEQELILLLDDILTPAEIAKVYERIRIVDCLGQKLSQRATLKKTGAAIATVSRGAELLKKDSLYLPKIIDKARKHSWWRALFWCA